MCYNNNVIREKLLFITLKVNLMATVNDKEREMATIIQGMFSEIVGDIKGSGAAPIERVTCFIYLDGEDPNLLLLTKERLQFYAWLYENDYVDRDTNFLRMADPDIKVHKF